jgi:cytochrome oxidase assembly protein ShyY1
VVGLGIWQLDRRSEKLAYEAQYFDRIGMLPADAVSSERHEPFTRLRLHGQYEANRSFLVDNQIHEGRPGYRVVTSFRDAGGRRWLVNRGWIAAAESRDRLPGFDTPKGRVTVVGVVWPDTGLPPLLAEDRWGAAWPKRVQRLDVAQMAAQLEAAEPVEIRLEAGQPGVFAAAELGVDFNPSRHLGYAVQWFGLALALITGYVIYGFRRHD